MKIGQPPGFCVLVERNLRRLSENNPESVRQFKLRVALGQPWEKVSIFPGRNSVGVASAPVNRRNTAQPLQGCKQSPRTFLHPGFQSQPWAEISQRFQRYSIAPLICHRARHDRAMTNCFSVSPLPSTSRNQFPALLLAAGRSC